MIRLKSSRTVFVFAVIGLLFLLSAGNVSAVPSFERQTGMKCTTCHTVFPELTPFGRLFKLGGYVLTKSNKAYEFPPPLAGMAQISFTHTDKSQPHGSVADKLANLSNSTRNDFLFVPQEMSIFFAGRIANKLGAYAQVTYDGTSNDFFLDMTDIRYSDSKTFLEKNLIYGVSVNNSPTLQDVWNTMPAFSFPFSVSSAAPSQAAAAILDGPLDQQVGGIGAYVLWNNLIYGEAAVYRTAKNGITRPLGAGTPTDVVVDDAAPYWRLVLQHQWNEHSMSVGTYGMNVKIFPGGKSSGPTDMFTDIAFDAQYQYIGQKHVVSAHAIWIHEDQDRDAGFALGNTSKRSESLDTFRLHCHYDYRAKFGILAGSLGYFSVAGDKDRLLYPPGEVSGSRTGSPDTKGFILEGDYLPWERLKLSVQYIIYDKFNGAHSDYDGFGRNASDNNALYLLAWFMF